MPFTKLDEEPTRVDKVSKTGAVYYSIWLDGAGEEYVQIVDNVGGTGAGQGSFSPNLFKLEDIGQGQVPEGYDPGSGQVVPSADNNMKAFLRVAKEDRMLRLKDD